MKALSLAQPFASLVACGFKTLETRQQRIHYRGPLVICSTKTFDADAWKLLRDDAAGFDALLHVLRAYGVGYGSHLPLGKTVALVEVTGCRPLERADWRRAFFYADNRFAWELSNIRRLDPRAVRGMNGLFPIDPLLVVESAASSGA